MIKKYNYIFRVTLLPIVVIVGIILFLSGCDLDFLNPNAPSEEQVLTTPEGIVNLANGLIRHYSTAMLEAHIVFTGTTAHELAIIATFANLLELEEGGTALPSSNPNVLSVWTEAYRTIEMANQLAENVVDITMPEGTRSGIIALAYLHKAKALAILAQAFEQAALDVDHNQTAKFHPRVDVLNEAIRLLENARQIINTTPPSGEFQLRIVGTKYDIKNSINAHIARFHLFVGNYNQALSEADNVDLGSTSVFAYDANRNSNPVYRHVYGLNRFRPIEKFGTAVTDENDARLDFYLGELRTQKSVLGKTVHELKGFFALHSSALPVYLPGEMLLIKAEAYARTNQLDNAINYINAVRTKTAAEDPFGLGASLPEYNGPETQEAILEEIYRQRTAELFLTGMRWEDNRRFNRPGPLDINPERNRNFYPYPENERDNNPNTPMDPNV